jgi:hypothetical protein
MSPTVDAETEEVPAATSGGAAFPVGVTLGSTRTVIAHPSEHGSGLTTSRTLTCLAEYDDPLTGETNYRYGEAAAAEYPDRVRYVLRSGLPDGETTALTEQFFTAVLEAHEIPEDSAVVYATPTLDDPAGLANLERVIENSPIGGRLVESYPESLCGAVPALGDGLEALNETFVSVNTGSTNLELAAYRRGEQLAPVTTGTVTGNEVDRAIANAVEEETQGRLNVDANTAREYKERHGDFDSFEPFTEIIQRPGGGTHEFTIERAVMDPLDDYLDGLVEQVANRFLPQLANEHMRVSRLALDRPVVLTGGMACLPGIVAEFEQRASEELGREITAVAPDRADLAATVGAQRIAARLGRQ